MNGEPENPFSELSEFSLTFEDRSVSNARLLAVLKFGLMNFEHEGVDYNIGVSKAYMSLELAGYRVVPGTSYGEHRLPSVTETKESITQDKAAASSQIKTNSSFPLPEMGGALETSVSGGTTTTRTKRVEHNPVRSLPNNRWEIVAPSTSKLREHIDGSVLISDQLCELVRNGRDNRESITGELYVRKIDVQVEATRQNQLLRRFNSYRNKEAIIGILASKAIGREGAARGLGANEKLMVISRHCLE